MNFMGVSLLPLSVVFAGLLSIVVVGFVCRWRQLAVTRVIGYSLILQAVAIGWAVTLSLSSLTLVLVAVLTAGIGFMIEVCGVHYGIPFGRYRYTGVLRPKIFGVPLHIGVAWWVVCVPAFAIAITVTDHPLLRLLIAAQLVAALDMFIDPIFVRLHCWRWEREGAFFGIPLVNYGGWFLTAAIIFACVQLFVPQFATTNHTTLIAIYALTVALHSIAMLIIWPWREWRILLFAIPLLCWPLLVLSLTR